MAKKKQPMPNVIMLYLHCTQCIEELPRGTAPNDYQHLEIGITEDLHLQVWCLRHEKEVAFFEMSKAQQDMFREKTCALHSGPGHKHD